MNNVLSIKKAFENKEISKPKFIDEMYALHSQLFDYVKLLNGTDISKIEITEKGITFTSKEDKLKLLCDKPDKRTAPFEILNFDTYETEDANMLYSLINEGDTVFDIGANIGWYSIGISKRFSNINVHSFEPVPFTFDNLTRNIKINKSKNIIANKFGLSDREDIISFYMSLYTTVSSSANNITEDNNAQLVSCKIVKMDDYVARTNTIVDFIKCDVEGAELFAFQGGYETLKLQKPIVFTEMLRKWSAKYNYHPNDIIELFTSIGYNCFTISAKNKLKPINQVTEETLETNFIFLHTEKHSSTIYKYAE